MKLEELEKREALVSAIEEQKLLIHEYESMAAYLEGRREEREADLRERYGEGLVHRAAEAAIRWKGWLAEALNAHRHNQLFYQERLDGRVKEE